ncbi:Eco57I restriction-modification methylase domain-containing protein [Streptomyces formicae]|uniref:Eco57I restriction-modification methylase domain-containing protein n=1 Tax=Streptomyces formicae TaxID=1616117 RepID=UPI00131C5032|nr:DNA methyltransferase [Streptomyces formicae]
MDEAARRLLRQAHRAWQSDPQRIHGDWIRHLLGSLLGWADALHEEPDLLARLAFHESGHQEPLTPSFALTSPDTHDPTAPEPSEIALLGLVCAPGTVPTARQPGTAWAESPADQLARMCRHHGTGLGLVAAGRWWTLVWAPRDAPTSYVTFDTADWASAADRPVVRAFLSLLCRRRFFSVPNDETLSHLLSHAEDETEDLTESLGRQVKEAVDLLVAAIGRTDQEARGSNRPGLGREPAAEVYKAALSTQMRILFVFFAEERGLLPADNPLYVSAYSAGALCVDLEAQARATSEEDLEQSHAAWHRLVALFRAVYQGVDHPRLQVCGYDGSLFDPRRHPWLEPGDGSSPWPVDDRTVLHMLRAVQFVTVGRGRTRERRRTAFGQLSISQIGHVYEGLLEYEGRRAADPVVGLIGKPGREIQVELAELERLAAEAAQHPDAPGRLAAALADRYKKSGLGTPKAVERALRPPETSEREEARRKLLAGTNGDLGLAERLLPFNGIIRRDLRGLPVVVSPGGLYVGRSSTRRTTGAHYTPEELAAEVARGALEPLVHSYGPLQTADRNTWVLKPSSEILRLKIADLACGSGAFLVAACRYLAEMLLKSRARGQQGKFLRETTDANADRTILRARREIAERCLYGVDINPLAVELAKFALWLETVEPGMPFTFLDDRLLDGDSLVGLASYAQLEAMHLLPGRRRVHDRSPVDFTATVPQLTGFGGNVERAARLRSSIVDIPGTSLVALEEKRRVLREAKEAVALQERVANLLVTASLDRAARGGSGFDDASVLAADHVRRWGKSDPAGRAEVERQMDEATRRGTRGALGADGDAWKPFHWPYRFPEVFRQGGFDAVIGNPPFLGGQRLTGSLGKSFRDYYVTGIGRSARGSADLVAYFLLRAHDLLNERGQTGLIATNTLAQGDTREVGLDCLVADGVELRQAVKSAPWPSRSAVLEYCAVWTSRAAVSPGGLRVADGVEVAGLTSSLDAVSRVTGAAHRLAENQGIAFIGSYVLGLGFTMQPQAAEVLIAQDERYRKVLFPYLNGQDLNSRPDGSASRWVINFHDWREERAKEFPAAYEQVRRLVKPEREKSNRPVRREKWWWFAERAKGLYAATERTDRTLVITLVSKVVMPVMVPTGQVFAHKLCVFASDDSAMLALLSSAPHYWWAISRSSTMKADLNYSPSDVFETLPRPELTPPLREAGHRLDTHRRAIMPARGGLTATYNLVHDEKCTDPDITELRTIHRTIDEEVARAYGWHDLLDQPGGLDHGFQDTRQGPRYTVGPVARQEILDRLLEENQRRYAVETNSRDAAPGQLSFEEERQPTAVTRAAPKRRPASVPSQSSPTSSPDGAVR